AELKKKKEKLLKKLDQKNEDTQTNQSQADESNKNGSE
ncbi:MAG: hypothetical protein ACI9XC_002371, partial [Gammaproteobacteria bacterium]